MESAQLNGANGGHSLTAKAYDAAKNVGTSAAVNVTVNNPGDIVAPVCQIISPANGSAVGNKANLSVSVSASDDRGVVSRIELYVDGVLFGKDTSSPWTFSVNTKQWARGAHTLAACAYDPAGNRSAFSTVTVSK